MICYLILWSLASPNWSWRGWFLRTSWCLPVLRMLSTSVIWCSCQASYLLTSLPSSFVNLIAHFPDIWPTYRVLTYKIVVLLFLYFMYYCFPFFLEVVCFIRVFFTPFFRRWFFIFRLIILCRCFLCCKIPYWLIE